MADRDTPQIASAGFEQLKRSERNLGPERFIPYPLFVTRIIPIILCSQFPYLWIRLTLLDKSIRHGTLLTLDPHLEGMGKSALLSSRSYGWKGYHHDLYRRVIIYMQCQMTSLR